MKIKTKILIIVLFVIMALIIFFLLPDTGYLYGNNGKLYISEVMANNLYTIKDSDQEYSDYIELYNGYGFDINLKDYYLSDKEYEVKMYQLPDVTIKSKEYLLIYASGKNKYENNEIHTNFRLSSKGEVITLSKDDGTIISKIRYLETRNDTSYGYRNRRYGYFYEPTPGKKNEGKFSSSPIKIETEKSPLMITEYMTNNERFNYDIEGDYHSWIEIYNSSEKEISLAKMFLSDNLSNINKYTFPDIVIKGHQYLIIYLSGKDKYENNEIHTNFKLGDKDKNIILSNKDGGIIQNIELVDLKDNVSYGLYDDKWCYYMYPTPGLSNNKNCFESQGDK